MLSSYRCVVESVPTSSITECYGNCSAADNRVLKRVVKSVQRMITSCSLPSLKDIYISRCRTRAVKISADPTHPVHELFTRHPSGRRHHRLGTWTIRLKCSFFPEAVRTMNSETLTVHRPLHLISIAPPTYCTF